MELDVVLHNARVVDGTGSPWFRGTIGLKDGTIEQVDRHRDNDLRGDTELDVSESVVCPGFIDLHSHSDLRVLDAPTLEPKLRQGITTEILGQDGFSMAPIYPSGGAQEWQSFLSGLAGSLTTEWDWQSTSEYLDAIDKRGTSINMAMLVGHGTVRYNVLGMEDTTPSDEELEEMADLVTESLEEGAIGFSTGLIYNPQVYADTEEVTRLARRLGPYGRPFVAHIRSEGRWIWEAMDEFYDIGAEEGIPVHHSHYKVSGREQMGKAKRANHLIEAARERGVDVTADQYPYTAGSTPLPGLLPPWVQADGPDAIKEHVSDPDSRERIKRDIEEWRIDGWENIAKKIGWENIYIASVKTDSNRHLEGKGFTEIADERGDHPVDVMCDLLIEEDLEVSTIEHGIDEEDVREIMKAEFVGIGTDGLFGGRPHPRVYGTYPRILGHYVREENLLSLEKAVQKMTSLPARAMGLQRKGLIRPGMDADLVVFDPDIVASPADFDQPKQFPVGIEHVLVNGEFAVRDEQTTGATPGSAIRM